MSDFHPDDYGPTFAPLLSVDRCRALDRGSPDRAWRDQLDQLTVDEAFEHTSVVNPQMAECCLSGVWLLHDFLDESHTISQSIDSAEGSFWHGAMHRREGDFSNAKYWFRHVGDHPVYEILAERFGEWDPYEFVDRCQAARGGADAAACRDAQQAEWEALFGWCYQHAVQ